MEKVALIELNEVDLKLVIMAVAQGGYYNVVETINENIRLGQNVLHEGLVTAGKITETLNILKMFRKVCENYSVSKVVSIATSFIKDAKNQKSFFDEIYNNGADLSMLLSDMMEWTHWATRMHPAIRAGNIDTVPYTADQREQIQKINSRVSLNTLSRIWQVMVAAVPEMQASGNQKQCFDMLIIRLMHIAEMPSIPEILEQQKSNSNTNTVAQPSATNNTGNTQKIAIENANDLANALQSSKEILLYSYYTSNIEITEISNGIIKYFDRRGDADFAHKLANWLENKTGHAWQLQRQTESSNTHTITEQKKEELQSDPLVASAMDLFADAEIVGIK